MFKIMTLLILFASIVGCSSKVNNTYNDLVSPDLTKTKRQAEYKTSAPTLGIAFGGGGVRGFMHLGVIKALKEANIHANVVTGVSAGSIAAVFYASGMDYQHLENTINNVEMSDVLDITLSSRGFIDGARLSDWINSQVKQSDLTQMPIPIGLVATNLSQQKSMLITKAIRVMPFRHLLPFPELLSLSKIREMCWLMAVFWMSCRSTILVNWELMS
ncbi:patatin-like phospholipase family protein [Vibrio olivae]